MTVLIHDQACATEERRARKRGTLAEPGVPRRHQRARVRGLRRLRREVQLPVACSRSRPSSAARRGSTRRRATRTARCLEGDCPSFMRVIAPQDGATARVRRRAGPASSCRSRCLVGPDDVRVRLSGSAAPASSRQPGARDGGVARRPPRRRPRPDRARAEGGAGRVRRAPRATQPIDGGVNVAGGHADLLLGFDVLGARRSRTSPPPTRSGRSRSSRRASRRPSGWSSTSTPRARTCRRRSARSTTVTRADDNVFLDAHALALASCSATRCRRT